LAVKDFRLGKNMVDIHLINAFSL